jgi:hypothetical protein
VYSRATTSSMALRPWPCLPAAGLLDLAWLGIVAVGGSLGERGGWLSLGVCLRWSLSQGFKVENAIFGVRQSVGGAEPWRAGETGAIARCSKRGLGISHAALDAYGLKRNIL